MYVRMSALLIGVYVVSCSSMQAPCDDAYQEIHEYNDSQNSRNEAVDKIFQAILLNDYSAALLVLETGEINPLDLEADRLYSTRLFSFAFEPTGYYFFASIFNLNYENIVANIFNYNNWVLDSLRLRIRGGRDSFYIRLKPLMLASALGRIDFVRLLLDFGVDPNSNVEGNNALFPCANKNDGVIRLLKKNGALYQPLSEEACGGNARIEDTLFRIYDMEWYGCRGTFPTKFRSDVLSNKYVEIFKTALTSQGICLTESERYAAAYSMYNHSELLKQVLLGIDDLGDVLDSNHKKYELMQAFFIAVGHNYVSQIQQLYIHIKITFGEPFLRKVLKASFFNCIATGNIDGCRQLISFPEFKELYNYFGDFLVQSLLHNDSAIMRLIMHMNPCCDKAMIYAMQPSTKENEALAAWQNEFNGCALRTTKEDAVKAYRQLWVYRRLCQSIVANDRKNVEHLLNDIACHALDINMSYAPSHTTLLMLAVRYSRTEIAALLLAHGADPDMCDAKGRSALYEACKEGKSALASKLLEFGAHPTFSLEELHDECSPEVVSELLSVGAQAVMPLSLRQFSFRGDDIRKIRYLVRAGAPTSEPIVRTVYRKTSFVQGYLRGRLIMCLKGLARPNPTSLYINEVKETLRIAASKNDSDFMRKMYLFLSSKIPECELSEELVGCLINACTRKAERTIIFLLTLPELKNRSDYQECLGESLEIALMHDHYKIAQLLFYADENNGEDAIKSLRSERAWQYIVKPSTRYNNAITRWCCARYQATIAALERDPSSRLGYLPRDLIVFYLLPMVTTDPKYVLNSN